MTDELIKKLEEVTAVSEDVKRKLHEEELDCDTFNLLTEIDMQELGFKMAARKRLLVWMINVAEQRMYHQNEPSASSPSSPYSILHSESGSVSSTPRPTRQQNQPQASSSSDNGSISTTPIGPPRQPLSTFEPNQLRDSSNRNDQATVVDFDVRCIIGAIDRVGAPVRGPDLIAKLTSGEYYDRNERVWMMKNLGRYLMENCTDKNRPSKQEKLAMVQSIVTCFPVLFDHKTPNGYEHLYDPVSKTGFLEFYIRQRRSRSSDITTMWTHNRSQRLNEPINIESGDMERLMKERRPTNANHSEMLDMMEKTQAVRHYWIENKNPDCTTVIQRFPRLFDMNSALEEEFSAIKSEARPLRSIWSKYRDPILNVANIRAGKDLELNDLLKDWQELDEDCKTQLSFRCLPYLLVPPPKRGLKKARMSKKITTDRLFQKFEGLTTVDEAIDIMTAGGIRQPTLFCCNDEYYIKLDKKPLHINEPS